MSVAFSPDGHRIASGSRDKTVWVWDSGSSECLEIIDGSGDTRAIAAGPAAYAYRLISRGLETVVEFASTGEPIARFPVAPEHITTGPCGRKWAAANVNHVTILELAGDAATAEDRPS